MKRNQLHLATFLFVLLCSLGTSYLKAQYCLPTYGSQCTSDDYINSVQFVSISNLNTGCGSPSVNNYTNYSGSLSTTVQAGATNSITVSPGPTWGQYFVAFIDLNQDQDFDDAGEFFDIGYSLGGGSVTANITVPCGAMAGTTRMRIMCRYANTPIVQTDVCTTGLSFGEVEDYGLTITMPGFTDAGISGFTAPVTACGMGATNPVSVTVYNCGGTTLTTGQLCYTFQGGASICETVTLNLAPGNSMTHTFSSTVNMAVAGPYTFTATITVASDAVPGNNTMNNYIVNNIPVITTLPYAQNFDVNNGGFTTAGTNSSWAWGAPNNLFINSAASSPNAWVTNLTGTYNLDELSYLVSPCFNFASLTADPFISFSHIFETPGFSDFGWVEVSTNSGTSWTKLGSTISNGNNWYNDSFYEGWTGTSGNAGQWRTADHRMDGTAGSSNVRFRFAFESDAFTEMEGFAVDNVRLRDTIINAGVTAINSPLNGCGLGSAATVSVDVTNYGTHTLSNYTACYTLDGAAPVCQVFSTPIPAGDTVTLTFTVPANVSVQGPHTVVSYTDLPRDSIFDNDTTTYGLVNFPLVATPYFQDFEAGQGDWISNGTNNDWAFGTPFKAVITGAASGVNAWVTGTTGFFDYADDANSWVESPCFDLTSLTNPWVATKIWWESENNYDAAILESSTDGGNTWNQIGTFGDPYYWYTYDNFFGPINAGLSGDGWGGTIASQLGSGAYRQAKHPILNLAGAASVRFRMHFVSDGSVTYDGIAFDDFAIAEPPVFNLGADVVVCSTYTINPNLPNTGTFLWSNNQTTPTLTVTTSGNYGLTYTDARGLCSMDTIQVTINPTPAVDLVPNFNVCAGTTTCISVDSMVYPVHIWSNGATTGSICIDSSGTWSVQVTDTVGCISTDQVTSTVVPLPNPQLGADTILCFGQTVCLDPNVSPTGNTFIWSNGASTPTVCTSIIAGYWVLVTDPNGCVASDSIIITPGPLVPVASFTADTSGCPVVVFSSNSSGQISGYAWNFGNGANSTLQNPTNDYSSSGNGTYTVNHIVSNGCGADTSTVTVTISCLVSIDGGLNSRLSVWPNPNQGRFNLETVLSGNAESMVEITNMQGQVVFSRDFGMAAGRFFQEITLDAHATGVYFVRFKVGEEVKVEKVVVE